MKKAITLLVCAGASLVLLSASAVAQTGEELYQKAVQLETVKGELEQAIGVYKSIVSKYPDNQPLAAKSLLRMGRCYEKLGKDEAKKAYERIIEEYASQPDVVAEARARLAALSSSTVAGASPAARLLFSNKDSSSARISSPGLIAPSPDGRRVAFLHKHAEERAVWVRDLETGDEEQVVAGQPPVEYSSVLWSPDGKRLAIRQDNSETKSSIIKTVDVISHEVALVPKLDAKGLRLLDWSRDGRYLLCSREGNMLKLVTVKDGSMTQVSDSNWIGQRASFSPDGRFVAFARGIYGHESVYTQLLTGGPRHRIADAREGVYLHPLWSPDGNAISYQQPDGIWVVPVTDGVASGSPRLAFKTDIPRWPVAWTQAGGYFLLYNAEQFNAFQVAVDPKTGQLGKDGPQEVPDSPDDLSGFAWSPDMQRIAYTGWDTKIRIYDTGTRTMTSYEIGPGIAYQPSWSGDGREIFYNAYDPPTRRGHIKVLNVRSGQVRDLFPLTNGFSFTRSADGTRVGFTRRGSSPGSGDVVVTDETHPDGRVVATGPLQTWGQISPRGDQVLYARKGDPDSPNANQNASNLWVVATAGSDARRVASAPMIYSAQWSPDGRFIAYLAHPDSGSEASVLRVVEVATGIQRGNIPLPDPHWDRIQLTDWPQAGKSIGFYSDSMWWEYWVIKDLEQGVR
jgi:Tol biopolymer transport system component